MNHFKVYGLSTLGLLLAVCAAFASTSFKQQAWYNAASEPGIDPTIVVFTSITSPHTDIRVPSTLCTTTASLNMCTINGRQAFQDQGLTQPLLRNF